MGDKAMKPNAPKKPVLVRDVFRRARQAAGLTQQELADKVGIPSLTVSRFENGTTGGQLDIATITRIERVLDKQPRKFLSIGALMPPSGAAPFTGTLTEQIAQELALEEEAEERRLLKEQASELRNRLIALEKEVTMLRAAMNKRKSKQQPKQRPHLTGQDELSENHLAMADRF
jgi:transcriptional regulator with XRE-family HTH domain